MKKPLCVLLLVLCLAGCMAAPEQTAEPATLPVTEAPTQAPTQPPTTVHVCDYTEEVAEPSCMEGGYTVFTCECGESYIGEETDALGHDMQEQVRQPSEEAPGSTLHTCLRCGESYEDSFTWLAQTPTDFFDDAAFLGDSITMGLRNYNMKYDLLGDAVFLCQKSYSVNHAVNNSMYLTYQGRDYKPEKALAHSGVKKVFILLGTNDIGLHSMEASMEHWEALVENIRKYSPDMQIYIQSGTPIYKSGERDDVTNARMDEYNRLLQAFAEEAGCHYIDIATMLKNEENGLAEAYCADHYIHLTYSACELWVQALKNYVGQ